jgi:50S ribosomal protein L16 3-hydroxylase
MREPPLPAPCALAHADGTVLGDVSVRSFLRRFWQRDALVVRRAIPGFTGIFRPGDLFAVARRDDVESRLVIRDGRRWVLRHGPFRRADFACLPERNWTLLVQGVNLVSGDGDALLRRFAFLPYARLDDLMVSYAAPGGGVGPHVDSYDVFLLQGSGRRRWRFGRQRNLALKPRLPLKILERFVPERTEILAPGDMLYLPPQHAHDGVALDACTTYSIGFRAPTATELAGAFLDFLRDEIDVPGRYADPGLAPSAHAGEIGAPMRRRFERLLAGVRWSRADVARFLGSWLSEPKPLVVFETPGAPLSRARFAALAGKRGLRLDLRTQLLYDETHLFINGTPVPYPPAGASALRSLADFRALAPSAAARLPHEAASILYIWYRDGYLHTTAGD